MEWDCGSLSSRSAAAESFFITVKSPQWVTSLFNWRIYAFSESLLKPVEHIMLWGWRRRAHEDEWKTRIIRSGTKNAFFLFLSFFVIKVLHFTRILLSSGSPSLLWSFSFLSLLIPSRVLFMKYDYAFDKLYWNIPVSFSLLRWKKSFANFVRSFVLLEEKMLVFHFSGIWVGK